MHSLAASKDVGIILKELFHHIIHFSSIIKRTNWSKLLITLLERKQAAIVAIVLAQKLEYDGIQHNIL